MTITLESIKVEQNKLAAIIAQFEEQAKQPAFFEYAGERIQLNQGEIYVSTILTPGEYESYHLILLPDEAESIGWKKALEWSAIQGGELPNRVEGALLFALHKSKFQNAAYWTRDEHSNDAWAWCQGFVNGGQGHYHKDDELRARAVRRLVIE